MSSPGVPRLAVAGGVAGLLVSAIQWLRPLFPHSLRARPRRYAFASSGSLSPAELLVSLVPHLLGGGPIGLETYAGPYNLAELDAYCGILSLVAIVALLPRLAFEHANRWRVWYLVGAIACCWPSARTLPSSTSSSTCRSWVSSGSQPCAHSLLDRVVDAARPLDRGPAGDTAGDVSPATVVGGSVAPVVVLGLVAATVLSAKAYGDSSTRSRVGLVAAAIAPYLVVTAVIALAPPQS